MLLKLAQIARTKHSVIKYKKRRFKTLINFNQRDRDQPVIIKSPRSLMALKRLGYTPDLLIMQSRNEIDRLYGFQLNPNELIYAVNYHEKKRKRRLKGAKEVRMYIIDHKEAPDPNIEEPPKKEVDPKTLAMLAEEAKELDKLKERQRNDIQQMIEKEIAKDDIRQRNAEKAIK